MNSFNVLYRDRIQVAQRSLRAGGADTDRVVTVKWTKYNSSAGTDVDFLNLAVVRDCNSNATRRFR